MDPLVSKPAPSADFLENHPFAGIRVGDGASLTRLVTERDIQLFAAVSGDVNPAHVDALYAKTSGFHEIIAHGMLGGALISTVLGTQFPGPGTIYLGQTLKFLKPVHIGDTLVVTVRVTSLEDTHHRVVLDTRCVDQDGDVVIEGEAQVIAPADKLRILRTDLPQPWMADKNLRYDQLLNAAKCLPKIRMGVVHPCSREALEGALDAARLGLIEAILIGPESRIRSLASECKLDLSGVSIVDAPHSHAAADKAVELARAGEVDALMKGSLHSDELLGAVVNAQCGLRTERRISHVFVLDVPRYPKPLLITDAAINVAPDAAAKADRGQITGGLVDGPLAFDNAVSLAAAKTKGITSEVAGDADILVVPDLESGNMLAKQLEYLGGAQAAGIVMGARVPIVLTSRADSAHSRIASCAITLLLISHRKNSFARAQA